MNCLSVWMSILIKVQGIYSASFIIFIQFQGTQHWVVLASSQYWAVYIFNTYTNLLAYDVFKLILSLRFGKLILGKF